MPSTAQVEETLDIPATAGGEETYELIEVSNLMLIKRLSEGTLGSLKYQAFTRLRQNDNAVLRIVRSADVPAYNTMANENYRSAYDGNPRSGTMRNDYLWRNSRAFPRLHS